MGCSGGFSFIYRLGEESEESRMELVESRKNAFHDRLPVNGGFRGYLETAAILVYGRHLLIVEIYHLPVLAAEGFLLFVKKVRRHSWG